VILEPGMGHHTFKALIYISSGTLIQKLDSSVIPSGLSSFLSTRKQLFSPGPFGN